MEQWGEEENEFRLKNKMAVQHYLFSIVVI